MVEYTINEILCYNSLLDRKKIQGIRLMFSPVTMKQEIIENTMKQLKEEQLVDEAGRLTVVGEAKLHIIRTYKDSDKYLLINNIAISFQKNRKMIMAVQNEEGKFIFETGDRTGIMLGLVKEYSFLQQKDNSSQKKREHMILSKEQWSEIEERLELKNFILLQKYERDKMKENIALFSDKMKCYEYNFESRELTEREPSEIRRKIMILLEVEDV